MSVRKCGRKYFHVANTNISWSMKNRDLNPFHGHRTVVLKIKDTLNLLKPPPWGAFAYSLLGCLSNIKNKDNKFSPALSLSLSPSRLFFLLEHFAYCSLYFAPRQPHQKWLADFWQGWRTKKEEKVGIVTGIQFCSKGRRVCKICLSCGKYQGHDRFHNFDVG